MSINKVMLSGNLTRDAEVRFNQAGTPIVTFGIAVNDRRKNSKTGQWEDYANYVDCAMFGAYGEKIQPYLLKGAKIAVGGKLRWSQWERDGQKRSKLEVIAEEVEFMSRGASRDQASGEDVKTHAEGQNMASSALSQAQMNAEAALFGGNRQQNAPQYNAMFSEDIPF